MSYKKLFTYTALLLLVTTLSLKLHAAHIAGGEFRLKHIKNDEYRLQIRFFRDCSAGENAPPFNPDPLLVGIYDIATNKIVDTFKLRTVDNYKSEFGNTNCITATNCIDINVYQATIYLTKEKYNNLAGYYISWERCCRNNVISNIKDPGAASMAYYMEIPSPYPGGSSVQVINSSPEFTRDPVEFLCVNKPFSYNFLSTEADGDSLVYSLTTPLNGNTSQDTTNVDNLYVRQGPYPPVTWEVGFDENNALNGNPDLTINRADGTISVTPTQQGVYVFAILIEEYRNGVKIGEVRRELELFVYVCKDEALNSPPQITGSIEGTEIVFETGKNTCVIVDLSDPENDVLEVSVKSDPINIMSKGAQITLIAATDSTPQRAQLCWEPDCSIPTDEPIIVLLSVTDNKGCPAKNVDDLGFTIKVGRLENTKPEITLVSPPSKLKFEIGKLNFLDFEITDPDIADLITLESQVVTPGNLVLGSDMLYQQSANTTANGPIKGKFSWTPKCNLIPGSKVDIRFIITDNTNCPKPGKDTITATLTLVEPDTANVAPKIVPVASLYEFRKQQETCYKFSFTDINIDSLAITATSTPYDIFSNGAVLSKTRGTSPFDIELCWTPPCGINSEIPVKVHLVLREVDNICDISLKDSTDFSIQVKEVANTAPVLSLTSSPDSLTFESGTYHCISFETIDAQNDSISQSVLITDGFDIFNNGAILTNTISKGKIISTLCWNAPCELDTSKRIKLLFTSNEVDVTCKKAKDTSQTITLRITNPSNIAPVVSLLSAPSAFNFILGQPNCINIAATDANKDSLTIDVISDDYDLFDNGATVNSQSKGTLSSAFCWTPPCNVLLDSILVRGIVRDKGRACMNRMADTTLFYINMIRPSNLAPTIALISPNRDLVFELGKESCLTLVSDDQDSDNMEVRFFPVLYDIFNYGAKAIDTTGKGSFSSKLCWTPPCNSDTLQTIGIDAVVFDKDRACMKQKADTVTFFITLKEPINTPPSILLSKQGSTLPATIGQPFCFNVTGTDDNLGDSLIIVTNMVPNLLTLGASIGPFSTIAPGEIRGEFCWTPPCNWDTLKGAKLTFSISDNACTKAISDTLNVAIDVIPQPNTRPLFTSPTDTTFTVIAGEKINFTLLGEDADNDSITITTVSDGAPAFDTLKNIGKREIDFEWKTNCDNVRKKPYELIYKIQEKGCAKNDSTLHKVSIEVLPNGKYYVPDIFSPNGDSKNDVLKVVEGLAQQRAGVYNFKVYNRWGEIIFQTTNIEDEWDGANATDGVYVYILNSESCPKQQTGLITIKH